MIQAENIKKNLGKLLKFMKMFPKEGQESVWDYPRPPLLVKSTRLAKVVFDGIVIAESNLLYRVLETSHPPVYYFSPRNVRMEFLKKTVHRSFCEWKGYAFYYSIQTKNKKILQAAWSYPAPTKSFLPLADYLAFYPSKMDACYLREEQVKAQPGDFYGGWISKEIVGPFKGDPGTETW